MTGLAGWMEAGAPEDARDDRNLPPFSGWCEWRTCAAGADATPWNSNQMRYHGFGIKPIRLGTTFATLARASASNPSVEASGSDKMEVAAYACPKILSHSTSQVALTQQKTGIQSSISVLIVSNNNFSFEFN
jgi:hypothetical protein